MATTVSKQKKPKDPNSIAPYEFVNNINQKSGVIDSFKVNTYYRDFYMDTLLSGRSDTLFFTHEVNQMNNLPPHIAKEMKYRFYYHGISENHNRRYPPVYGKDKEYFNEEHIRAIMEWYKISRTKAEDLASWLPYQEMEKYVEYTDKGGKNGKKDDAAIKKLYEQRQSYWCADFDD